MTYAYIEKPLHDYYRARYPRLQGVCISEAQNRMLGGGLPVIPYGVDVARIPFGAVPEDFLLTVGRLVPAQGRGPRDRDRAPGRACRWSSSAT